MADDLVLGVLGEIGSSLLSVYSTYEQGKLRRILNRHNAAMKDINARLVKTRTDQLIKRLGIREQRELGRARADSVGEGFALDSGTNLAIEGDIITARAIDREIIRTNGGLEETRLNIQAGQDRLRGDIATSQANVENVRTLFGTTSRLLERIDKKTTKTIPKLTGIGRVVR